MFWCFAKVNNRLAEIYFEMRNGKPLVFGHCYVRREEYRTKREKKMIREDSARCVFTYRRGKYRHIKNTLKDSDRVEVDAGKGIVKKL